MKKICFIVAMEDEVDIPYLLECENFRVIEEKPFKILQSHDDKNLYLIFSSIGMVCAASATQYMLDRYRIEAFINLGSTGTVNPDVNSLDCYLIDASYYGDCDLSAFNYQPNQMARQPAFFQSNKDLNTWLLKDSLVSCLKLKNGTCYSINSFLTRENQHLFKTMLSQNPSCIEMELIGISQVCYQNQCAWSAIKIISDSILEKKLSADQFRENLKIIQKTLTDIIISLRNCFDE